MRSAAALSYHLSLLSSLIRVTVGGPTSSFVQGHTAGLLLDGPAPRVVTPSFIMVSPTQRTSMS